MMDDTLSEQVQYISIGAGITGTHQLQKAHHGTYSILYTQILGSVSLPSSFMMKCKVWTLLDPLQFHWTKANVTWLQTARHCTGSLE